MLLKYCFVNVTVHHFCILLTVIYQIGGLIAYQMCFTNQLNFVCRKFLNLLHQRYSVTKPIYVKIRFKIHKNLSVTVHPQIE